MKKITKPVRLLAVIAAFSCITAITGIAAYNTGTDSKTNTFTIGSVEIELEEPGFESRTDTEQGVSIAKDPVIANTGESTAFVFAEVKIPKQNIYTYDPADLSKNARADTELVQINSGSEAVYGKPADHNMTASHTCGSGWTLVSADRTDPEYSSYIYAYAAGGSCTALGKGEKTSPVFDSVTYCYAVEGQGLDEDSFRTDVTAYAIQADGMAETGMSEVWETIRNQMG